jgi:hypothetical protein
VFQILSAAMLRRRQGVKKINGDKLGDAAEHIPVKSRQLSINGLSCFFCCHVLGNTLTYLAFGSLKTDQKCHLESSFHDIKPSLIIRKMQ